MAKILALEDSKRTAEKSMAPNVVIPTIDKTRLQRESQHLKYLLLPHLKERKEGRNIPKQNKQKAENK